jgi:thiosulfate sulfurtransferase
MSMSYKRIKVEEARELIEASNARVADVRDPGSYKAGHIPGAESIDDMNLRSFIEGADFDRPLIVCCYHGNMSQGAAEYFSTNGFKETYSLDGGYEAWQSHSVAPPSRPAAQAPGISDLPETARVWIYGAEEALTVTQCQALKAHMEGFLAEWNSHQQKVMPGWQLVHDQFVIISADETTMNISGCSIDSMFHALEAFNRASGLKFASSGNQVFYRDNTGVVCCVDRPTFGKLAKQGAVTEETIVFNNVIQTVGEFVALRWEVPMRDSWHMEVFGKSLARSS